MSTPETTNPQPTPLSDALHANGYWNPNWDPIAEVDKVVAAKEQDLLAV